MLFPDVPDPDASYIEDPCVAMLSFGAWVERECWERLPFICYEDRFYGQVNVSNITSSSASLTWARGLGNITHYRLEVTGPQYITNVTQTELTYSLSSLTAGTTYSVQVFPVKCGRDLNPENATFYTVPSQVSNLHVVNQTDSCVWLNWTKPSSHVDLYIIEAKGSTKDFNDTGGQMCGLASGSLHTFTVRSAVKNQTSDGSTISAYTKPGNVSNLRTLDVNCSSLLLKWDPPSGGSTVYRITYFWDNDSQAECEVKQNEKTITDLPSGSKITLSVTALVNGSLRGDPETVSSYTVSQPVTNLTLIPKPRTIIAKWNYIEGIPNFIVELYPPPSDSSKGTQYVNETTATFEGLQSAVKYTVYVYSGSKERPPVSMSMFTPPLPPTDVKLANQNTTHLTFTWKPPEDAGTNSGKYTYFLTLNSSFWGQKWEEVLIDKTTNTFGSLNPGTSYTFQVQVITSKRENMSEPVNLTTFTDSNEKEITLSMMCSSRQSFLCDDEQTRQGIFDQLQSRFNNSLGGGVKWKLERANSTNTKK